MAGRSKGSSRYTENAAIARAKREWQCIADALPQLVCLLDRNGGVIRANRVVERWGIGQVRDVLGLDLHTLLHRGCQAVDCPLRLALAGAWKVLPAAAASEFEIADPVL